MRLLLIDVQQPDVADIQGSRLRPDPENLPATWDAITRALGRAETDVIAIGNYGGPLGILIVLGIPRELRPRVVILTGGTVHPSIQPKYEELGVSADHFCRRGDPFAQLLQTWPAHAGPADTSVSPSPSPPVLPDDAPLRP